MWLWLAWVFVGLTALAVGKNQRWLEILTKPTVMVVLILYLVSEGGGQGALVWFVLGLIFSLVGDVFLLWPDRWFLAGLAAFLLAQIAYLIGFNLPPSPLSWWGLGLALIVGYGSARILRRLMEALHEKGQESLRGPVLAYGVAIALMLLSALLKLSDAGWGETPAVLVAGGALLFFLSDVILAWNRFVAPVRQGRLLNMVLYHLGQVGIAAGVAIQFGGG